MQFPISLDTLTTSKLIPDIGLYVGATYTTTDSHQVFILQCSQSWRKKVYKLGKYAILLCILYLVYFLFYKGNPIYFLCNITWTFCGLVSWYRHYILSWIFCTSQFANCTTLHMFHFIMRLYPYLFYSNDHINVFICYIILFLVCN